MLTEAVPTGVRPVLLLETGSVWMLKRAQKDVKVVRRKKQQEVDGERGQVESVAVRSHAGGWAAGAEHGAMVIYFKADLQRQKVRREPPY
jgi:hypothetical protein